MSPSAAAVAPSLSSPLQEAIARDSVVAWFRGEFAAANAIIDALCNHLTQITNPDQIAEYESVFLAVHRRRLNWIPVLQMQKYYSIAEIAIELRDLATKKKQKVNEREENRSVCNSKVKVARVENGAPGEDAKGSGVTDHDLDGVESSDQKTESGEGSHLENSSSDSYQIFSDNQDSKERLTRIKITKGFVAKEPVRGHMVNVVKGLKLYEDIFTELELSKLTNFINELHLAGQKGQLSGDTFILFNQQLKGNKREIIQLGIPIFGSLKDDATYNIEPIPPILQTVIDHLIECHLLPEKRRPNGCLINFFNEGEYSQPYIKPPHLDQPVSTLFLSESTMTFGRVLISDNLGDCKGSLRLSLKEGSLLVMRGNSTDMAQHVMCPSSNRRVIITFFKVREPDTSRINPSAIPPLTRAMTLWQPGQPQACKLQSRPTGHGSMGVVSKWGLVHAAPLVMIGSAPPAMVVNPSRRISRGGTGVFLPWTIGSKKSTRHLPPRIQRGSLHSLSHSTEIQTAKLPPDISVAG
ncbi:RNA demethylase ALKBH10B-like isoform X2 [Aristolochia californica]|uniref:RNA demethylase ALKBH10B-like isoform X2 n=1 Tax=Aristolochia californica TaxID=171875 RepID=UPI0035DCEC8F